MLNTKDVGGFLRPLARHCTSLTALTIPGETNAVPALDLEAAGQAEGINSSSGEAIDTVLKSLAKNHPHARILICGSLYLAGHVLRENSKD
jgi:dihydrofolate synthase/folylpolyglutamate synthase